jgi:hypothetical protein
VARIRATSTPTIPKAPVKTRSRKLLPNEAKGLTQPTCCAAAAALGHVASTAKGGEVLFA